MTSNENLLLVAMEECAEVQKAISKLMRFGKTNELGVKMNDREVMIEFYQLTAVIQMCVEQGLLPKFDRDCIEAEITYSKREKVLRYLEYSKELGLVKDFEEEK